MTLRKDVVVTHVLAATVLLSALAVVITRHYGRAEFVESQRLQHERDELRVEWERLQLERGTFQTYGHVEMRVREELGMEYPREVVTVVVP